MINEKKTKKQLKRTRYLAGDIDLFRSSVVYDFDDEFHIARRLLFARLRHSRGRSASTSLFLFFFLLLLLLFFFRWESATFLAFENCVITAETVQSRVETPVAIWLRLRN